MNAIDIAGVTFTYPGSEAPALTDVSVSIPTGSFALVTGLTGSGKSSLLRCMNGLVPHFTGGSFAGSVAVGGRDTIDNPPRRLADVVAFVPQDPSASFVVDRVEDELAYAMENLAVEPSKMRRRVEETLDLLGIEPLRDRSVRSLSGGERQRVAIAAALTPGARILLLDEPTSQLDPQGAQDVLDALRLLVHDHGYTVVVAEHRLDRVAGYADLALGCTGGVVTSGAPAEVLAAMEAGPPVARLGRMLGWSPVPLTVREARYHARSISLPASVPPAETTGGPPVLVAGKVTTGYGDRVALHDVSLAIAPGEVVALLGRNGTGKSTLLRTLAGLHQPFSGTVSFAGGPPSTGRDVALCPQSPDDLLFSDSVAKEISATLRHSSPGKSPSASMAEIGIESVADRHPRDLSAGQRLLVAIAAIAATDAPALLLDEPTRGLDPETKEKLGEVMAGWADQQRVVVFATHDVEMVAELATRVVVLAAGRIVADGSPEDVLGDSNVFSPQMTRVFGPGWLTFRQVAAALGVS